MKRFRIRFAVAIFAAVASYQTVNAQTVAPGFAGDYTATSLGSVPGVPTRYGGLTILAGDTNKLLIGGSANTAAGRLYTIDLVRDADNHIVGFSGTATQFGEIGEFNDGGVTYGPNGVLFTAQWNVHRLGQTLPGSTDEDRVDSLADIVPASSSISAIFFVPPAFGGAGQAKVVTWSVGDFGDLQLIPDGSGTFDIGTFSQTATLPGGPEGFVYIDDVNPGFNVDSMLVSDFSANRVSAYEVDGNGDPIVSTRRDFVIGLVGAEGAAIDPVTGDFLFSTFGGANQVIVVEGFAPPTPVIELLKQVSVDGGATYEDADTPASAPVQTVPGGADYRLVINNIGEADAVNVLVSDPSLGISNFLVGDIDSGDSATVTSADIPQLGVEVRCVDEGLFLNIAEVRAEGAGSGITASDEDPAYVSCMTVEPLACDIDGNGIVDRNDIAQILARRNQPASGPGDPADVDGDGAITVLDARKCVLRCTNPGCTP